MSSNTTINGSIVACSSSQPYTVTNGICQTPLTSILLSMNCVLDREGNILVLQNEESTASELISGLEFLQPSDACRKAVVPFFCLYLFGLCDESGVSIQPTSGQCKEIRDVLCSREWATAVSFEFPLPDCNIFPDESAACSAQAGNSSDRSGSGSGSGEKIFGIIILS